MTRDAVGKIAWLTLNVPDLERSVGFYVGALGFKVDDRAAGRALLSVGAQRIELLAQPGAVPYPVKRAANDPWFQHFAIAVSDMDAAYAQLSRFSPEPITRRGPRLLPPSTGSVTAYKFRDPDGHPLELSQAPGSSWSKFATAGASVFLGIDHTALAVRSIDASVAFYTALGFRTGDRSVNRGPEQADLDGLDDPVVDIVTLMTAEEGPHVELLHYRSPPMAPPREAGERNIAVTCTVLASLGARGGGKAMTSLRDPDGHLLGLLRA